MVSVEVTSVAPVAFDVAIHDGKRSHAVHVRDDGWALYLKSPTGSSLGRIDIPGERSKRLPHIRTAMVYVRKWAEETYGN